MYENQKYKPGKRRRKGLVHSVFGTGPGKTSRAVGLAVRMVGAGGKVTFVQFMKSGDSAEVGVLKQLSGVQYLCPGKMPFILPKGPKAEHYNHAQTALAWSYEHSRNECDLLICDEILDALYFNLVKPEQLNDLIVGKREETELVLTGAFLPQEVAALSDYVTQLIQIKHPYYTGVDARKGIEY